VTFGLEAAKRYGEIRSRERVRPADAIQLACAAAAGTDLFPVLSADKHHARQHS
jgi:predicted nucleic acid-binding protein